MSIKERFIEAYVHYGRVGVLVEISADSQVMMQTEAFNHLARDLAMHIAAADPKDLETLSVQPFVKDASVTVAQYISRIADELHEHLAVTRFMRWDTECRRPEASPTPPDRPAVAMRLKEAK